MASASVQEAQDVKAEMSFAPMIDCVFQLLIFFLVCSTVKQTEDHMKVYLPTDEGVSPQHIELPQHPEPVYVLVRDDDAGRTATTAMAKYARGATYYVNSTNSVAFHDLNQLRECLKDLHAAPDTQLIIYPADERDHRDQKTPWKNVLGVVDAGYWAGFSKIQFRPAKEFW